MVSNIQIGCQYFQTSRILMLNNTLLASTTQVQLKVFGVTNPSTAKTTESFVITTYTNNGTDFLLVETGGSGIKVTTTPGAITQQNLILSNPTIGLFSNLALSMVAQHSIPANGQIQFQLPKWNQLDPTTADFEPMIAVATSPSEIPCLIQSGITSISSCLFTIGVSTDSLNIQLNQTLNIKPNTMINVTIQGFRAPPSQSTVNGFTLTTADANGIAIDQVQNQSSITLQALYPVMSSASSVVVSANITTVSSNAKFTISVQNFNPLLRGSTILIQFPSEFYLNNETINVTTSAGSLNPNPNIKVQSNQIQIGQFNVDYLQQYEVSYFYIQGIQNPSNTKQTSSFAVQILDPNLQLVEYVSQGIFFQATAGSFVSATLQPNNPYINTQNVNYTFQFVPSNSFNSQGVLMLKFPDSIYVSSNAYITAASTNMNITSSNQIISFNSVFIIQNAFPNGYQQGENIQFSIIGITNPKSTMKTDPIEIQIYYESKVNGTVSQMIIDDYTGLTFTALPSLLLQLQVQVSVNQTGAINKLNITGFTPPSMIIQQGSNLRILIPNQFTITDPVRAASSCSQISGFSDEISCSWQISNSLSYLIVSGGFASKQFPGGTFSFSISEIMNPISTKQSDPIGMQIIDNLGYLLYVATSQPINVSPSNFAFSFVSSSSPVNGASSIYTVSLTMSVNTQSGTICQVDLPDQIQPDNSKQFFCMGTLGLIKDLQCNLTGRSIFITLKPDSQSQFLNGTTINFQLGFLFNSIMSSRTDSFKISTYDSQWLINSRVTGLAIQNTQRAPISIKNITQTGSNELALPTQMFFQIQSTNEIPYLSKLTIILPNTFLMSTSVSVLVNEVQEDSTIDPTTNTITVVIGSTNQNLKNFKILIQQGLANPVSGPYSYSGFGFEFTSQNGYAIDATYSDTIWTAISCSGYCSQCVNNLNNCIACGADPFKQVVSYLHLNTCVLNCPSGWFASSQYQCQKCQSPCLQCSYASDLCTQCDPQFGKPLANLVTLSCTDVCPSGTYLDAVNKQCIGCSKPCYTCTSANLCLTCDITANNPFIYFYQTQCYKQCPAISVSSPSKNCVDCEAPCKTCVDRPDKCSTCTSGLYLYKNLCVESCPFNYYKDHDQMECKSIAALEIPFPFTICAIICSVFMGISHFMKNGSGDKEGETFFISCLALISILLRINWFVLGCLSIGKQYFGSAGWCAYLLIMTLCINFAVWRRFFKFKYNLDDNDEQFLQYCKSYPKTSRTIIFLSYGISFQAIRLTYSRILGKKMFCASFSRQKKFTRLIGQLSVMEIFAIYIPAIGLNIYDIFFYKLGEQIFYIGVDSLFLIVYATILITIILCQREKVLHPMILFDWKELLRFNVASDDEKLYTYDQPEETELPKKKKVQVFGAFEEDENESARIPFASTMLKPECKQEVMSEQGFKELRKVKIYQTELRQEVVNTKVDIIDYNLYRQLVDKLDRTKLKTHLYENQSSVQKENYFKITKQKNLAVKEHDDLQKQLSNIKRELRILKIKIDQAQKIPNPEQKLENVRSPIRERRQSLPPVIENFPPLITEKQKLRHQKKKSQERSKRAFYFDKYSRKVYYDEQSQKNDGEKNNQVVVINQKTKSRRGTLAYKQAQQLGLIMEN